MGYWTYRDAETAEWGGTLKAKRMKDDGSAPVQDNDIVNKAYVDGLIGGMLTAFDDGTYITISFGAVKLFRIEKLTGQMQIAGGYDSDTVL